MNQITGKDTCLNDLVTLFKVIAGWLFVAELLPQPINGQVYLMGPMTTIFSEV